jgi:hypothetical protein
MTGVQRNQSLDVDLASHVCRGCVAGGLRRTISPLSVMLLRLTEKDKPESFAHTARQRRSNLAEPTLQHRYHGSVHDQHKPTSSREKHTKPRATAQYENKKLPFSKMRGVQSTFIQSVTTLVSAEMLLMLESHNPRKNTPRCRSLQCMRARIKDPHKTVVLT